MLSNDSNYNVVLCVNPPLKWTLSDRTDWNSIFLKRFISLEGVVTERDTEWYLPSICSLCRWLIMPEVTPNQSQDSGVSSESPLWEERHKQLGNLKLLFQAHCPGAGLEMKPLRLELLCIQGAALQPGAACYATRSVPESVIFLTILCSVTS